MIAHLENARPRHPHRRQGRRKITFRATQLKLGIQAADLAVQILCFAQTRSVRTTLLSFASTARSTSIATQHMVDTCGRDTEFALVCLDPPEEVERGGDEEEE